MKILDDRIWESTLYGFFVFAVIACVANPVGIDLPENHPANPLAQETAFVRPTNPFMQTAGYEDGSSSMTQKQHVPAHQMRHPTDQTAKDTMPTPKPDTKVDDHQHKERKQ